MDLTPILTTNMFLKRVEEKEVCMYDRIYFWDGAERAILSSFIVGNHKPCLKPGRRGIFKKQ